MSGIDYYTKLMLHFNGTNNSTFIEDNSIYNKTVTANQNCIISTSQSKFDGASCYFDGVSCVSAPSHTDFQWATGDVTIDFWIYRISNNTTTTGIVFSTDGGNGSPWTNHTTCYIYNTGSIALGRPGVNEIASSTGVISLNTWYHIAIVKQSSTTKIYINGNSVLDSTTNVWTDSIYSLGIGSPVNAITTGYPWIGYIDEFRISKGIARWTTNFEPPIQAYTLASTVPQNTGGIDSSTLLYLYSDSQPNGTVKFTDNSQQKSAIIPNNTIGVTHSTIQTKFTSSSIKFNGTSFLMIPSNSIFDIGTNDFTLDSWFYVTSIPTCSRTIARGGLEAVEGAWCFGFGTVWGGGTKINFAIRQGGANRDYSSPALTIPTNEWNHLALVRASGILYFFLNGLTIYTVACTHTLSCAGEVLTLSARYSSSYSPIEFLSGYQDSIRFSNTAKWTSDFIPPTTLYTGNYIISGYVKEQMIPVPRIVRAHNRTTGDILQETTSSSIDGSFTLHLVSNETCYVVALDDNSGLDYNALIFDKISPE